MIIIGIVVTKYIQMLWRASTRREIHSEKGSGKAQGNVKESQARQLSNLSSLRDRFVGFSNHSLISSKGDKCFAVFNKSLSANK